MLCTLKKSLTRLPDAGNTMLHVPVSCGGALASLGSLSSVGDALASLATSYWSFPPATMTDSVALPLPA